MDKIKVKLGLPDYKDLIRYGVIVSDLELEEHGISTRIRKIRYMGILYHLKMKGGEVVSLLQWDGFSYMEDDLDIVALSDDALANKLMLSDRDRKIDANAEVVYWLCVREINKRIDGQ